jgi:hypothetical protein
MADTRRKILEKGVHAALELGATSNWQDLTLAAIAEQAGLKLADFHGAAGKDAIADAVEAHFDKAMSEGSFDQDETPRTRLFDVIMMRFEAMEAHRDALVSLMSWRQTQPLRLLNLVSARQASAEWALTCSRLDTSEGLPRPVRTAAVAWSITQAERAWRKEDSADLSRTMASLDGELRKMEERAGWIKGRFGKRRSPAGETPETSTPETSTGDEPTTDHQPS